MTKKEREMENENEKRKPRRKRKIEIEEEEIKTSKKENKFCEYYTETGDIKESAVRAGYKNNPEKLCISTISDPRLLSIISRSRGLWRFLG